MPGMHNTSGNISLLDCTLRDGGWVQDFQFGSEAMQEILYGLEEAGVPRIETGYLDKAHGSGKERSMYADFAAFERNGIQNRRRPGTEHIVMIDCGKYPAEMIPAAENAAGTGISGIRICFHKDGAEKAIHLGRDILDKGYSLYMQPMVTTRYTQEEFSNLIRAVMKHLPETAAVYLVDSFGVMDGPEVSERLLLMDRVLPPETAAGLHIHNNRGQCRKMAETACELLGGKRKLYIDGTLGGIGKGAGNLETQEFAAYLNQNWGTGYDTERLNRITEAVIRPISEEYHWGILPEYELTARYRTSPTYANFFFREKQVSLRQLETLLANLPEEKKDSFDRPFAAAFFEEMAGHE